MLPSLLIQCPQNEYPLKPARLGPGGTGDPSAAHLLTRIYDKYPRMRDAVNAGHLDPASIVNRLTLADLNQLFQVEQAVLGSPQRHHSNLRLWLSPPTCLVFRRLQTEGSSWTTPRLYRSRRQNRMGPRPVRVRPFHLVVSHSR